MIRIVFLILVCSCVCFSCSNEATDNTSKSREVDSAGVTTQNKDSVTKVCDPFSLSNIQAYNDSLTVYFKKVYKGRKINYQVKIDSAITDKSKRYFYKFHCKGCNQYSSYTKISAFSNDSLARDYFNDLKTQELILGFGLTKSYNDITLNNNQVIWHTYEHPYLHRATDLKRMFRNSTGFYAKAANADSLGGLNYCHCEDEHKDLSVLSGRWKIKKRFQNWMADRKVFHSYDSGKRDTVVLTSLFVKKDSVFINGKGYTPRYMHTIRLPDSYYFLKYNLVGWSSTDQESDSLKSVGLSKEYLKEDKRLSALKCEVTTFAVNINNDLSIEILMFGNGEFFAYFGEGFYKIQR